MFLLMYLAWVDQLRLEARPGIFSQLLTVFTDGEFSQQRGDGTAVFFAHEAQQVPVYCAVMMWLSNPDAIPAQPSLVHGLAECREGFNQIITALPYRFAGPLRVWPAVVEGGMEAGRASDGIEHGAVTAHFSNQLQPFDAGHHFVAAVGRVAIAGVHHVFHIQRVAVGVYQLMRFEKLQ